MQCWLVIVELQVMIKHTMFGPAGERVAPSGLHSDNVTVMTTVGTEDVFNTISHPLLQQSAHTTVWWSHLSQYFFLMSLSYQYQSSDFLNNSTKTLGVASFNSPRQKAWLSPELKYKWVFQGSWGRKKTKKDSGDPSLPLFGLRLFPRRIKWTHPLSLNILPRF